MEDDIKELDNLFGFDKRSMKIKNFGDVIFKICPPLYRFFKFKIPDVFYDIKYLCQKTFKKSHTSDIELWNLDYYLAKIICRKLTAYRNADRVGYPCDFCDWEDGDSSLGTKEEYEKAKAEGKYVGGGFDGWNKTLDEMILGFEWVIADGDLNDKKKKDFYKKYGYKDPERKTDDNLSWSYTYKSNNSVMTCGELLDLSLEENKKYELLGKYKVYYDDKLQIEISTRARKGVELFGKYFGSLWD